MIIYFFQLLSINGEVHEPLILNLNLHPSPAKQRIHLHIDIVAGGKLGLEE